LTVSLPLCFAPLREPFSRSNVAVWIFHAKAQSYSNIPTRRLSAASAVGSTSSAIGCRRRGFVGVAEQTIVRCVERITRLYEQGADAVRIGKGHRGPRTDYRRLSNIK
jgi:hypothetical protein